MLTGNESITTTTHNYLSNWLSRS